MSEVVNLRQARKQRRRTEAREGASVRAAAFGESSADRRLRATEARLDERRLDQHRVEVGAAAVPPSLDPVPPERE